MSDAPATAMTFAIRADADGRIGHGHVMRCLTLAESSLRRGAGVSFICRENEGHLCDMLDARGFEVHRLPRRLNATWQQDAAETRAAIAGAGFDPSWLIVDHYGVDVSWEQALRPSVGRIMVIDDLANRTHDCDLLLDQNIVACMRDRYASKVPPDCSLLLGPEFAMLQPEYADLHDRVPPRAGAVTRVLVFFGGSDTGNLTGLTLAALRRLGRSDIAVDVVIADSYPKAAAIRREAAADGSFAVHCGLRTLAPLMAKADLAVGAGGSTTWERLCLGLPSLVVTVADNQRPIAEELQRRGLIAWLGDQASVREQTVYDALKPLLEDGINEAWSARCRATIDGRGVTRVCAALTVTSATALRVRHAGLDDEACLLDWANDPATRRRGFHPDPISEASHHRWFHEHLRDLDGCRLYIIETEEGIPLGQVRFQRDEESWEVHYSLAQPFRGRGLGRPLLRSALLKARQELPGTTIVGQVKPDNVASRRIFESLGFATREAAVDAESVVYECVL